MSGNKSCQEMPEADSGAGQETLFDEELLLWSMSLTVEERVLRNRERVQAILEVQGDAAST